MTVAAPVEAPYPEEIEASAILDRADQELTALEERTDRLMYHYGL